MELKDFIKNEPMFLKIIYLLAVIFLFINLNDLTTGKNELNYIYPIIAFSGIILFIIRMSLFVKKNE